VLRLTDVIIDCPDALALAGFWSRVLDLPVKPDSAADWAGIALGELELAFTPVEDYRPPRWPDAAHPKQFHLDLEVDDLEDEHGRVVGLGAELRQDHVDAEGFGFRVYADPVGHPFCLCRNRGVAWVEGRPRWPGRG
jgi:predicted enzyme related to lactoylglutathione lyase